MSESATASFARSSAQSRELRSAKHSRGRGKSRHRRQLISALWNRKASSPCTLRWPTARERSPHRSFAPNQRTPYPQVQNCKSANLRGNPSRGHLDPSIQLEVAGLVVLQFCSSVCLHTRELIFDSGIADQTSQARGGTIWHVRVI